MAERLMPPGVRSLRAMLQATAVEVLLYLTPLHCHDMLSSLVEALNAQFSKFMLRHPDFQVSAGVGPNRGSSIPAPAHTCCGRLLEARLSYLCTCQSATPT